jgi:hypothetical protein
MRINKNAYLKDFTDLDHNVMDIKEWDDFTCDIVTSDKYHDLCHKIIYLEDLESILEMYDDEPKKTKYLNSILNIMRNKDLEFIIL